MKDVYWYYKEFDRLEKAKVESQDNNQIDKLEKELDRLHDEFYDLEDE